MRKRILVFLFALVFALSQVSLVMAKGSTGGGRSGGSSHSSSSRSAGSYSKSSTKSSSSGYSGSSTSRSVPGSYSSGSSSTGSSSSSGYTGSSSSKSSSGNTGSTTASSSSSSKSSESKTAYSSAGVNSKTDTAKNSYMQDYYKKESSKNNYNTYKQNLNDEQKRIYDSSMNGSYKVNNRMSFEDAMRTRPQRMSTYDTRPIRVRVNNYYFGGPLSYGSAFVGPWDLWFLLRASDLFWYHHWHEIYAHRDYFDAADFAARERAIRQMEAQNIARDTAYLDPDVDPDLQFSNDYQQKHLNNIYYTNKYSRPVSSPVTTIIVIVIIAVGLIVVIKLVSRPKPKKTFDSKIY